MPNHEAPSPRKSPEELKFPFAEVGSVFRIGDKNKTRDVIAVDPTKSDHIYRFLIWEPGDNDEELARIAGWEDFIAGKIEGKWFVEVPNGTRPARGILGGVQAWDGEKAEVIQFIVDYTKMVYEQFGAVDTSVSLDTTARSNDGRFFITPPHNLVRDENEINIWSEGVRSDICEVTITDENRQALAVSFGQAVNAIRHGK